ncbi:SOS response-associated peptidase [Tenacibaculum sp. 190524A02b]|uniref:SOS response-associated peptidase n=1 Tax=Tenacibaculum vairaonense TaxID=3137860 RepID=UPI0031FA7F44
MCFHISNTKSAKQNEERFEASFIASEIYEPTYHFTGFENRYMYIIKQDEYDDIQPAYWGLLPEYAKISERKKFLGKYKTYNATAERILKRESMAAKSIMDQRCLILVDGFIEPHYVSGVSIPHYIKYKDHSLFAFAGVYTELDDGLYTATIITTKANDYFASVHNKKKNGSFRMPLVLDQYNEIDWLSGDLNEGDVDELLFSFTKKEFEDYPVSKKVEKGNVNYPEILERVDYSELNNSLFDNN